MSQLIPLKNLPKCHMRRIIAHWTAGKHKASTIDRQHYHFIIEADGNVVIGDHPVSDNVTTKGGYAAHTLGCNTGSIGIAVACMLGAVEAPFNSGSAPMTQTQWNTLAKAIAQLCSAYAIPVTPQTVLSHAEVQANLGIRQKGKWDIARLAFKLEIKGAKACGDLLRAQVRAAMPDVTVA